MHIRRLNAGILFGTAEHRAVELAVSVLGQEEAPESVRSHAHAILGQWTTKAENALSIGYFICPVSADRLPMPKGGPCLW